MNYVGSYKNTATPTVNGTQYPYYWVPAWITFDAGIGYTFRGDLWSGFKGTRIFLNATNVFNQTPPVVLTSNTAMDPINANPYGRMLTISFTKDF
jgi:outer membrane receptor protein involved in Fe transport